MIRLNDISVQYAKKKSDVFALQNVNIEIKQGELLAITGASGSGKSTLLGILGGLHRAYKGEYYFHGDLVGDFDGKKMSQFRGERLGFIFQNFCLLPHLNVLDNVLLPTEHITKDKHSLKDKALELLDRVGISDLASRLPTQISGGQAQRVAIARALIRSPQIILADEPTGNLDDQSAEQIINLLRELCEQGSTLVIVTHNEQVAMSMNRRIFLQNGRVVN